VETRRSTDFLPILTWMRPSWGTRFLGDAHRAGYDLDAAGDGALDFLGGLVIFMEDPVDAEADAEALLEGLEMNVGGAHFVGLEKEHGDHLDNGSSPVSAVSPSGADGGGIAELDGLAAKSGLEAVEGILGCAVVADEGGLDLGKGSSQTKSMSRLRDVADGVEGIEVEGLLVAMRRAGIREATGMTFSGGQSPRGGAR